MARFQNFLKDEMTEAAVEERRVPMTVTLGVPDYQTRFFIKIGFAGSNTRANNGNGYATKAKAEATILDYQNRR